MARIPGTEIERLKAEVSVERLVESAGVELKAAGKDLLGRCPFHEDRRGLAGRDAREEPVALLWLPDRRRPHRLDDEDEGVCRSATRWSCCAKGRSLFSRAVSRQPHPGVAGADAPSMPDEQALLPETIAYYHERLKQTPEALAYLASAASTMRTLIERFRLGFADRTLGLRLPEKTRKAGDEIRSRLEKLGLFRAMRSRTLQRLDRDPGHRRSRRGHGSLRPQDHATTCAPAPRNTYTCPARIAACGTKPRSPSQEIILCEALIDAMTFWCAGYRNVTARLRHRRLHRG